MHKPFTPIVRLFGRAARALGPVAAGLGIPLVVGAAIVAHPAGAQNLQYRSPDNVPVAWVRYAELVQYRLTEWLAADNETVARFHLFLQEKSAAADGPPENLLVKVWVAPDGKIDRIEAPSLNNQQTDADLRAILGQGDVGEAPPADMLQPLRLRLTLKWKA
jgi:hypothetical protein